MDFGGNGLDFATFVNSAMRNNGYGNGDGLYGGNGLLWIFLLILFWGNNGWGNRGNATNGAIDVAVGEAVEKAVAQARADGLSDQVITDAVRGNREAIQQLATTLNVDLSAIRTSLCALDKGIAQLSGEIGYTGEKVINAIQMGNMQITSQLANCCCEIKTQLLTQSYETRIQNMQQTEQLTGVMNAGFALLGQKFDQTQAMMAAGFQGIKDYLCDEKINTLQHQVTQYETAQNTSQQLAPLTAQLNQLISAVPPRAVPAYPAPQYYNWSGWNSGNGSCGCGNGFGFGYNGFNA